MVNSTRTEFTPLPVRTTRNRREVLHFPVTSRTENELGVKRSENAYERGECTQSQGDNLKPGEAHHQYEGREVTCVQGSAQVQLVPTATKLEQQSKDCLQSTGNLQPLSAQSAIVPPVIQRLTEKAGSDLSPVSSVDQLEGYEPRYFLKEDGRDDVS